MYTQKVGQMSYDNHPLWIDVMYFPKQQNDYLGIDKLFCIIFFLEFKIILK